MTTTILVTTLLASTGCDDEPTCTIATALTGGYEAPIRWSLGGRDSCGVGSPVNLDPSGSALVFVNNEQAVKQHLILVPNTPIPQVGVYPARILLIAGGNIWDSGLGNCSVEISQFSYEDWTLIDFINISGRAACTTPLSSASAQFEDASFVEVIEFTAHLHDEQLAFEFL